VPLFDQEFLRVLEYLDVIARKRLSSLERGERQGHRRGSSAEFLDHRGYAPGDDIRHLDWRIYHRFGELVLKLYREEQNLEVSVLLDTSASTDLEGTTKRETMLKLAAAFAYIGMSNLDRARVQPFAATLSESAFVASGKGRVQDLFAFLESLPAEGTTDLRLAASQLAARMRTRGVIVLISDFYDLRGLEPALRVLRGRRNDVGLIHVHAPSEVSPGLHGELRLEDVETGSMRELTVTDGLRARYRAAFEGNRRRVAESARRFQMGHVDASTDEDLVALLVRAIQGGGVLA
jgi:uncharacterized protein (DUF58 family)